MSYVENPEAIGNPDQTPRLFVSQALRALLNPCECGGVNRFHADTCKHATPENSYHRDSEDTP